MASLNITITASNSALSGFADDLGYQAQIEEVDEEGVSTMVDNPESKKDYLARRVEDIVASGLTQEASKTIKQTKLAEATTEKATLLSQIKGATEVTITA